MHGIFKYLLTCFSNIFYQSNTGSIEEFFLSTKPESSGPAPTRTPPPIPVTTPVPISTTFSKSQSFQSSHEQELTVDDIEDFEDEEVDDFRIARRQPNNASSLLLQLPSFATGKYE